MTPPEDQSTDSFAPTERTRLKRSHQRAVTEKERVYAVLDAAIACHIGYVIDGQPFVTPTAYARIGNRVYWHGSNASRMMKTLRAGARLCFTVSLLDGMVLARSGFHSSFNYRSVMAFGAAEEVSAPAEKERILEVIVERFTPGRWADLREMTTQELKATAVMGLELEEVACKIRDGGPIDDEEDYDLDIWAGVVPLTTAAGAPVPDERLKPGVPAPGYLKDISIG